MLDLLKRLFKLVHGREPKEKPPKASDKPAEPADNRKEHDSDGYKSDDWDVESEDDKKPAAKELAKKAAVGEKPKEPVACQLVS